MRKDDQTYNFIILRHNSLDSYTYWVSAIESCGFKINYRTIDLVKADWLSEVLNESVDMVLVSPPYVTPRNKILFDEIIYLLSEILNINTYPSYNAWLVYENKRMLDYVLKVLSIPHPETSVFNDKAEAIQFTEKCRYPIVAKLITGASGLGVKFLGNAKEARSYVETAFRIGISAKTGPDFRKPDLIKRAYNCLRNPAYLRQLIRNYVQVYGDKQLGSVFFQEFIPHSYEWRCVRIDQSYFAHKKMVKNRMASGYLIKSYEKPSSELLDFVSDVSEKLRIDSAAFDIFETEDGKFLVNEVQAFFGQSDPHQMIIDNIPGRFIISNGEWIFQPGNFNSNKSYDLRLQHCLKILGQD